MNRSFDMKPAAKTHVPSCEGGEMTKDQQAAVDRYRELQAAIDRARGNRKVRNLSIVLSNG